MDKSAKKSSNKTAKKSASKSSNKKTVNKITNKSKKVNKKSSKVAKIEPIKKEKKSSKKVLVLATFIILSLAIIGVTYYLIRSPKFNITSIVVTGNTKTSSEEIIAKSGISIGQNAIKSIFKINKNSIMETPYIESIKATIDFPSKFVIKINERKSTYFAYDKEKNVYYRLDNRGVILEQCNSIDLKGQELLVNGITFDKEVRLNTKINDVDYSKILVYKEIEQTFYDLFTDKNITKVSFENSLTKIYLNDKIEVVLPNNTNLRYNLTFLKDILNSIGDTQGTIDMTKENPTFIAL